MMGAKACWKFCWKAARNVCMACTDCNMAVASNCGVVAWAGKFVGLAAAWA